MVEILPLVGILCAAMCIIRAFEFVLSIAR